MKRRTSESARRRPRLLLALVVILALVFVAIRYRARRDKEEEDDDDEPWPRGTMRLLTANSPKIDAVYTWVNGSDPEFVKTLNHWAKKEKTSPHSDVEDGSATEKKRFNDNDELRYSLRSLEKYANWINNVYIVTNGQIPTWLDLNNPRVRVVTHSDIYPDPSHLPTFSSPSIETHLHRIPGLSNYFLYLNDDVFFGAPTTPQDFLLDGDVQRVYLSWEIPDCAPSCSDSFIGDNYCDVPCNVSQCNFDGGDCIEKPTSGKHSSFGEKVGNFGDWTDDDPMLSSSSSKKKPKEDTHCAKGCETYWVGDGICDSACYKSVTCGFDGGDCKMEEKRLNLLPRFAIPFIQPPVPSSEDDASSLVGAKSYNNNNNNKKGKKIDAVVEVALPKSHLYSAEDSLGMKKQNATIAATAIPWRAFLIDFDSLYPGLDASNRTELRAKRSLSASSVVTTVMKNDHVRLATYVKKWNAILFVMRGWPEGSTPAVDEKPADGKTMTKTKKKKSKSNVVSMDVAFEVEEDGRERGGDTTEESDSYADGESARRFTVKSARRNDGRVRPISLELRIELTERSETKENRALLTVMTPKETKTAAKNADNKKKAKPSLNDDISVGDEAMEEEDLDWGLGEYAGEAGSLGELSSTSMPPYDEGNSIIPSLTPAPTTPDLFGLSLLSTKSELVKYLGDRFRVSSAWRDEEVGGEEGSGEFSTTRLPPGRFNTKVPAHMPHLINVEVMNRLQRALPEAYKRTSAGRFRDKDDIQFAYAYFTYLMHYEDADAEMVQFVLEELIDTNKDRCISGVNELRTLVSILVRFDESVLDLDVAAVEEVEEATGKKVKPKVKSDDDDSLEIGELEAEMERDEDDYEERRERRKHLTPSVFRRVANKVATTKSLLSPLIHLIGKPDETHTACFVPLGTLQNHLTKKTFETLARSGRDWHRRNRPRYSLVHDTADYVSFVMLRDNLTSVEPKLDGLRSKRTKFVCINDDTTGTTARENDSRNKRNDGAEALRTFYESLFPFPSSFELSGGRSNDKGLESSLSGATVPATPLATPGSSMPPIKTQETKKKNAQFAAPWLLFIPSALTALLLFVFIRSVGSRLFSEKSLRRIKARGIWVPSFLLGGNSAAATAKATTTPHHRYV